MNPHHGILYVISAILGAAVAYELVQVAHLLSLAPPVK